MSSVTQTIPTFLGGVSKQPDVKKRQGQMTDIINGLPDPTAGLMKRPGFAYVTKNGDSPEYDGAKWFHAFRDKRESYFGVIVGSTIKIWDANTGVEASVVEGSVDGTVTDISPVDDPSQVAKAIINTHGAMAKNLCEGGWKKYQSCFSEQIVVDKYLKLFETVNH